MKKTIFISYSHQDEEWALEMASKLKKKGITTFVAKRDVRPGKEWEDQIFEAIRTSNLVLALMTPNALKSDWMKVELGAARGLEKPIVSARAYVEAIDLMDIIRKYQSYDARTEKKVNLLIADLRVMVE